MNTRHPADVPGYFKMSVQAQRAARGLAVSYAAYLNAIQQTETAWNEKERMNSVFVWATRLLKTQNQTGIKIVSCEKLMADIEKAEAVLGH